VVIALIGAWFLIGPGQAKPPPKKVTPPVVENVEVVECKEPVGQTCVTWEYPKAKADDIYVVTLEGVDGFVEKTFLSPNLPYTVQFTGEQCATVTPKRNNERGDTATSKNCDPS
jgi:hypothetical protein